jgi:hypothetical protein
LLHSFLPEFLLLVAPRQAHRLKLEHGEFLRQETFTGFPGGDLRRADVVYRTETLSGRPEVVLIHVETESRFRREFDRRMARYGLSLFLRHDVSLLPVALFLKGGAEAEQREIYPRMVELDAAGFWFARYRYLAVALSQGKAERYLRRKDPLAAALAALMPYRSGSPAEHKLRCLRKIAAARELNPLRSFQLSNIVQKYIQLDTREEKKFQTIITDDIREEVNRMETFWERNEREWTEIGVLRGKQQILLQLLELRFGKLPKQVTERVEACRDDAQIRRWSGDLLSAPDLESMGLGS